MQTSYFGRANSKAFKERGLNFVSVARSCRYWNGPSYPDLFPTWEMIHMTDKDEYEKVYREKVLNKLDPMKVWEDLQDCIILCHESIAKIESGETFCHRHIIARWLEEELWIRGIDVKITELKDDKADLKKTLKRAKQVKQEVQCDGQMELEW